MGIRFCLLFLILDTYTLHAARPACDLCFTRSLSCSSQVNHFNISEDDCKMKYYPRNGKECSSLVFDRQSHLADLGTVVLQSYLYTDAARQSAFNISFMNIKWTRMTMRFTQNGHPEKNTCREFHVSERFLALNFVRLFYDCLWSRSEYEDKTYTFEYMSSNSHISTYHNYVFIVPQGDRINPSDTKLSDWQVFMYIDISSSQMVVLKCQTLPKQYKVTNYMVKVYSVTDNYSVCKEEKNITANEDDYEITYKWHLGILPGSYYFTVQPLSGACGKSGCMVSKSPDISISSPFNPVYIGCALVAAIVLGLICVFLKLRMRIFGSKDLESAGNPTLLLIYRSIHSSHIKVVVKLAKYLRKHYNINALVDELDIKMSDSQDPFHWYNNAVADADFIAIVSSPNCCDSISGIYPKVDEAALCLLRGNAFKREHFLKVYNLMVFMLPYCSKRHLPAESKNIGLIFNIPNQLKEVSYYIHYFREMYFIERLYHWLKARMNYIWSIVNHKMSSNNKSLWSELQEAIQEASAEVTSCIVNESKTDLMKAKCLDTKIFLDKRKENLDLEDHLKDNTSEFLTLDAEKVYAEFPGPLDHLDLLKLNSTGVIKNSDSEIDSPLYHLRL